MGRGGRRGEHPAQATLSLTGGSHKLDHAERWAKLEYHWDKSTSHPDKIE